MRPATGNTEAAARASHSPVSRTWEEPRFEFGMRRFRALFLYFFFSPVKVGNSGAIFSASGIRRLYTDLRYLYLFSRCRLDLCVFVVLLRFIGIQSGVCSVWDPDFCMYLNDDLNLIFIVLPKLKKKKNCYVII